MARQAESLVRRKIRITIKAVFHKLKTKYTLKRKKAQAAQNEPLCAKLDKTLNDLKAIRQPDLVDACVARYQGRKQDKERSQLELDIMNHADVERMVASLHQTNPRRIKKIKKEQREEMEPLIEELEPNAGDSVFLTSLKKPVFQQKASTDTVPKKKNRPGQRARKRMVEDKINGSGDHRRPKRKKVDHNREGDHAMPQPKKNEFKARVEPVDASLHPSWAAKKQQSGIAEFKGSKITF